MLIREEEEEGQIGASLNYIISILVGPVHTQIKKCLFLYLPTFIVR